MPYSSLFPKSQVIGRFSGFVGNGNSLEFHANLVLPYRNDFHCRPMHGQYLLVQLETPDEAILGRIVSLGSDSQSKKYDDSCQQALLEYNEIPEEVCRKGLKYRVNMQVLGVLSKQSDQSFFFVPSHRRLPHLGSKVAFPTEQVLREIAGHNIVGAPIGHLALGQYIYAGKSHSTKKEEWMQLLQPEVLIRFPIHNIIARRSFIFARAGFGKSNLNKLLFSELYKKTPTVTKRGNKQVPVGTIIFDPDGEYFWPDDKGRPGLCDVPELQDKIVVFTPREGPSPFYQSFVAGDVKLDIREFAAADLLSTALCAQKQGQQNVQKLKGLRGEKWRKLVNLIAKEGNATPTEKIKTILNLDKKQEFEALAARSNMTTITRTLHSKNSRLLQILTAALAEGKLCIIDISQLHDAESLILSGLILRYFFQKNQEDFTKSVSQSLPIITVIEEAQSVLTKRSPAAEAHRDWVKEGRKYDLGALLITQQPGSIPLEILSQGDNWFVLHLLSTVDLRNLQKANSHFSQDIICMLLNESIPGHATFWSSVGGKPYPISMRVLSFEQKYSMLDPNYNKPAANTFATTYNDIPMETDEGEDEEDEDEEERDIMDEEESERDLLLSVEA